MRPAVVTAIVLGLLATAGVAHAITAKQFTQRADKICKSKNVQLSKLLPPKSPKEIAGLLRRTLRIVRPAQAKLEKIPLPSGSKRATARRAVRYSREAVNLLAATSRKIDQGRDPTRTVQGAEQEALRLAKRQSAEWRRLGSKHCPTT